MSYFVFNVPYHNGTFKRLKLRIILQFELFDINNNSILEIKRFNVNICMYLVVALCEVVQK